MQKSILAFLALVIASPICLASGESPIGSGLSVILGWVTGTTGITAATLGVAGVGVACTYGYLEWSRFLQTIIGVAIVFGSTAIVAAITAAAR